MPKEITHFALANSLARAVPGTSAFYSPVQRFPYLFCLGAVTPDIPFFTLAGPGADKIQALSIPFHGKDSRALGPVLKFLDRHRSEPALALAAGVICHVLSDTRFHPLVYYYSGMDLIHNGATARHRQFETAMDLYFQYQYPGETSLGQVAKHIEISRAHLNRLLMALFQAEPGLETGVNRSLTWFIAFQTLFRSSIVRTSMAWFSRRGRPLPEKITGLIYPSKKPVCLPFFDGDIQFQDPCTGDQVNTRMEEMVSWVVRSGLQILDLVSTAMDSKRPPSHILDHPDLPLVRPDLPVETFDVWREITDLIPLLYPEDKFQYIF